MTLESVTHLLREAGLRSADVKATRGKDDEHVVVRCVFGVRKTQEQQLMRRATIALRLQGYEVRPGEPWYIVVTEPETAP